MESGDPCQLCLKGSNAAAHFSVLDEQFAAIVHCAGGPQRHRQLVAGSAMALKASGQNFDVGSGGGHVQRSLWAAERGLPLCSQL